MNRQFTKYFIGFAALISYILSGCREEITELPSLRITDEFAAYTAFDSASYWVYERKLPEPAIDTLKINQVWRQIPVIFSAFNEETRIVFLGNDEINLSSILGLYVHQPVVAFSPFCPGRNGPLQLDGNKILKPVSLILEESPVPEVIFPFLQNRSCQPGCIGGHIKYKIHYFQDFKPIFNGCMSTFEDISQTV